MGMSNIFDLIEPIWKIATNLEKANKEREKRNAIEILKLRLEVIKLVNPENKNNICLILEELNLLTKKVS